MRNLPNRIAHKYGGPRTDRGWLGKVQDGVQFWLLFQYRYMVRTRQYHTHMCYSVQSQSAWKWVEIFFNMVWREYLCSLIMLQLRYKSLHQQCCRNTMACDDLTWKMRWNILETKVHFISCVRIKHETTKDTFYERNSYFSKTNTVTKYIPSSKSPLMKKLKYLLPAKLETFNARP
jgi:hypothetical protein